MQVNVEKISPVVVQFDVEVAAAQVQAAVDRAYSDLARNARVPGFRKGRAPRKVLVHLFGPRVAADVAQRLVDETFPKAVTEQKLQPVSAPQIERHKVERSKPFTYKARFEIIPQIESVSYADLEASRPKVAVADEEVKQELEGLREAHASFEPIKESRASRKGDFVTFSLGIEVEGETFEEAESEELSAELGSGQLLEQLDKALTEVEPGTEVEAEVTLPDAHPEPRLRGATATFKMKLTAIKERILPELDDELAKDLGDFETLAELESDVRARLEKQATEQAEGAVAEQLVKALVAANPIPLPPSLVERQTRITEQEILSRAGNQGRPATGIADTLRKQIMEDSERKVRAGLLMAEIAKQEKIQIGEAEIEEGLKELAEQSGKNLAKLRAEYRETSKRELLIGMIMENKVLDIIESKAKIREEETSDEPTT